MKRLVGAQGLEPWTRCLKGGGFCNEINVFITFTVFYPNGEQRI